MSSYEDSRIVDAEKDTLCCGCYQIMPSGYRYFLYDDGTVLRRYHVHCARAKGLKARCLEPRKPRCLPLPVED